MDCQVRAQAGALDDTRLRLKAVLDNATVSIFLMDDRQHCAYMNRAAEDLTGYTFAEVEALARPLHDIIHHTYPDGRDFPLSECAIDRAFPEHAQTKGEEVFVHRDGSFYPVAFTASPIMDEASNTVGTIIEVRDIRAEKRSQELQELLLHELSHRVKNTLATVQSIAWQTFKGSDRQAAERFNARLAALSHAHDILTGAAWETASVEDISRAVLRPIDEKRIEIEGPDCFIHPKAAVTLAMVLHELATNAVKHGALRELPGRVCLRWTCEAAGSEQKLDILWRESGGPPVERPAHGGFGTRLIERQLGLEFGGTAKLDFRPDGLVCRIQMTLPAGGMAMAAERVAGPRS